MWVSVANTTDLRRFLPRWKPQTPLSRAAPYTSRDSETKDAERDNTHRITVQSKVTAVPSPTKKGYLHIDAQRSVCDSLVPSAEIRHPHCDRLLFVENDPLVISRCNRYFYYTYLKNKWKRCLYTTAHHSFTQKCILLHFVMDI